MLSASMVILLPWLVGFGAMALMVAALLSLGRAQGTQRQLVTWLAIIVLAPVLGPAVWFVMGNEQRSRSAR